MDLPEKFKAIRGYFNQSEQIVLWPKKHSKKRLVLDFLIEKFEYDRIYTEKEVNMILNQHHIFEDPALLRRSFFGAKMMDRTIDGRQYWRIKKEK